MDDFLIIGGGIAGLSAGARLSRLGRTVLIEAESNLAYHASGRSAAMFEEHYGAPRVVALNRASRHYHETEYGGVLSPRGVMLIGGLGQEDALAHDLKTMNLKRISFQEAQSKVPILNAKSIVGIGYHAEAWDIDTDRLMSNFAREIRGNGQIVTAAKATKITKETDGWHVETTNGSFSAKILVNAAGPWADDIATMAEIKPIKLQPFRRSIARISAPNGHDVSTWPMFMGANESWYAKPDAGALIVSPEEQHPMPAHDAWADDMVLAEGIARYQDHVTEPVTRMISNWAGLRTFAPDRNLVLGPAPDDTSFIWCAGQGGYGFQTAPAASQLLADLIAGRSPQFSPDVVQDFSPSRFQ